MYINIPELENPRRYPAAYYYWDAEHQCISYWYPNGSGGISKQELAVDTDLQALIKRLNQASQEALKPGSTFKREKGELTIDAVRRCRAELQVGLYEAKQIVSQEPTHSQTYIKVVYKEGPQEQAYCLVSLTLGTILPYEAAQVLHMQEESTIVFPQEGYYCCTLYYFSRLNQWVNVGKLSACQQYFHPHQEPLSIDELRDETRVVYQGTIDVCLLLQKEIKDAYKQGLRDAARALAEYAQTIG